MSEISSSSSSTNNLVHIYRRKPWVFLVNIFSLMLIWIIIGIPLALLLLIAASMTSALQQEAELSMIGASILCLLFPIIVLMSLFLIWQTIGVILAFFSYVKITSEGLEQKAWPYIHIRCSWADVDRIGKHFLSLYDALYLKSYEVIGPSTSLAIRSRLFPSSQRFISLSGYSGWPDGQLAEDLRRYAPQLFERQPDALEAAADNKPHPSGLSQEERLLAALSHASIMFQMIGVVVPIVIWANQKKKSSYVAFQALQASIWQAIALAFQVIVLPACVVGATLIPVFMIASSESDATLGLAPAGWVVFATIAGVSLAVFVSVAFVVYALVGAVKAYLGESFRYAIIAKYLEKRGLSSNGRSGVEYRE